MWVFLCLISPAEFYGLTLVDIWRFLKCTWPPDRQVTWKSRWGPFTLTHNPTNFNCHWRCETGDPPFCENNVITWYMRHVTRWLRSTQRMSHIAKIGGHCLTESGDKAFLHITWSHDQWVMRRVGWDTLILNHKGYSKSNRTQ